MTAGILGVLGWAYPVAFIAAGVLVVVRFRGTPTGMLAGGSFFGMAARSIGVALWSALRQGGMHDYAVVSLVMTVTSALLYVVLAFGIFAIPSSLKKLGLRAGSQPTTF